MLLRIIIENFLSFKDTVQFDMFPNRKRTALDYHVYTHGVVPVLKQAAVYGANGAGKSNLVKALGFIRDFATDKDFLEHDHADKWVYALQKAPNELPLEIALEFLVNDTEGYIYAISISKRGVEKEKLYKSGFGDGAPTPVFERAAGEVKFNFEIPDNLRVLVKRLLKRNPNSSFLALNGEFPVVAGRDIFRALAWLRNSLVLIDSSSTVPALIHMLRKDKALMEFTDETMRKLCLGISSVDIETEDASEWVMKHADMISPDEIDRLKDNEFIARMDNERQSVSAFSEHGVKKVARFVFNQYGTDGYIGKMDISNQSDGTVRLLTLLPGLYEAIYKGRTVIIDEINHQMHPALILGLVKRFATDRNTKGQLIFTTHETSFLEEVPKRWEECGEKRKFEVRDIKKHKEKLLRNDEIWFAEKKEGQTRLYSLNDFKFHNTLSVRNAYFDGRFGAYPVYCLEDVE